MQTLQNVGPLIKANITVEKGCTYWLTGLPGSGKSSFAEHAKKVLDQAIGTDTRVFVLDGDQVRQGLNSGLGFSVEDRAENVRRVGEVAKLMNQAGMIVLCCFVSPEADPRKKVAETHQAGNCEFQEIFCCASSAKCEERDPKGLWKKARAGQIPNFTGVDGPYDEPSKESLHIDTGALDFTQCTRILQDDLFKRKVISNNSGERPVVSTLVFTDKLTVEAAKAYPKLEIDEMQAQFVQTIGEGWANPLKRFMNEMELLECMNKKTLTVGDKVHLMSVPITQHVTEAQKVAFANAKNITLTYKGRNLAVINAPVFFENRKEEICTRTFGCFSQQHPYAENIMSQGEWLVSGESMDFIEKVMWNDEMDCYRLTPAEISTRAKQMKADAVFAFQVRNPLHNGHCLLLKQTRLDLIAQGYKNPVLLLHPLGGWCKDDDVPLGPRMKQHQALIDDGTIDSRHIILAVWPSPMFYGGPTEVLWHASSRVGCGITHFITGRDPAGVGHPVKKDKDGKGTNLYDGWHGQKLLVHNQSFLQGVEVLPFKVAALNTVKGEMEFFNPKAENAKDFKFVSGSEMRKLGAAGAEQPKGFMSPAGWKVLQEYYQKEADVGSAKLAHAGLEAPRLAPVKVAQSKTSMPASKCEAPAVKHEVKMVDDIPVVQEKKEEKAAETTAEAKSEDGTNWALIGLGAAAIGAAAYFFMKHNK